MSDITIRTANGSDVSALRRLAQLDSQPDLTGTVLVAEVGGDAVAAIALASGRTVADPFEPTADVVELLRIRSNGSHGHRRRSLRLLPRLA